MLGLCHMHKATLLFSSGPLFGDTCVCEEKLGLATCYLHFEPYNYSDSRATGDTHITSDSYVMWVFQIPILMIFIFLV